MSIHTLPQACSSRHQAQARDAKSGSEKARSTLFVFIPSSCKEESRIIKKTREPDNGILYNKLINEI